ncbi:MAG: T9SS type A sorting domain-containing protein [Bacteroidales bacterium]|nr:T9SS type A sorting domain-containing protein [Bacteroidales bacterium]
MKKIVLSAILILMGLGYTLAQQVQGIIFQDTLGITVIKVWGTHQQRGYAIGYLTGLKITAVMMNYIKPQFGSYYTTARNIVIQGNDITIPQEYKNEAQGIIDGMNAAGSNTGNLDQTDILIGNCLLDIGNLLSLNLGPGCSTLMSWGDATTGTDLNGKSVVSRHLDWSYSSVLVNNNILIVHFPSEPGETKWLIAGYAGMLSALSGLNRDFSAFQQVMSDFSGAGLHNKHYLPIWIALRKALESEDYNGDGANNVQDLRSVLQDCPNGFADGFIVTSLGRTVPADSLVAMVAELTPISPTHTYRYNDYDDIIPGDNLYASNYQIKRNNAHNYDDRYYSIAANIGNGTMISLDSNWNLLRDHSHQSINMQFMQFAPEIDIFRMSVYRNGHPAYQNEPLIFDLNQLFADPTVSVNEAVPIARIHIYPNPVTDLLTMTGITPGTYHFEIVNPAGRIVLTNRAPLPHSGINVSSLTPGIYMIRLTGKNQVYTSRFMKK